MTRLTLIVAVALAACSSPEPNTFIDVAPACGQVPELGFAPSTRTHWVQVGKDLVVSETETFTYDREGRLERHQSETVDTLYEYLDGQLTDITYNGEEGPWHSLVYDADGRLETVELKFQRGGAWQLEERERLEYDEAGRLIQQTHEVLQDDNRTWLPVPDAPGERLTWDHDDLGRVTTETAWTWEAEGTWRETGTGRDWTWSPRGRLDGRTVRWETGAASDSEIEHDELDRVITSRSTDSKACRDKRSTWSYEGDVMIEDIEDLDVCGTGQPTDERFETTYSRVGTSEAWQVDPRPTDWRWTVYGSGAGCGAAG